MSHFELLKTLATRKVPGQLVIQITDACNATCGQCGMRVSNRFKRHTLEPDQIRRIIDKAAKDGVQALSFTGGEPLMHLDTLVDMIHYAGKAGIAYIRTGTNGFLLRCGTNEEKFMDKTKILAEKLAGSPLRNFWISLDSADARRHEELRGLKGVVKGIELALPIFHATGLYPSVNLGINRFTGGAGAPLSLRSDTPNGHEVFYEQARAAFSNFYRFVTSLGFTIANACYPMSMADESRAVYSASSTDDIVNFTGTEKILLLEALKNVIPGFRRKIRIFSPLCSLYALIRQYKKHPVHSRCLGGIDFFFVDAVKAHAYPCGYRAQDDLGPFRDLDLGTVDQDIFCDACDWECFRDPSELFAPFINLFSLSWYKKMVKDRQFLRLWAKDLLYYRACRYFDGRQPPALG